MQEGEESAIWEAFRDPRSGRVYYGNRETGESQWNAPPKGVRCIPHLAEDILNSWQAFRSSLHSNELFFINSLTGERVWDRPLDFLGMPLWVRQFRKY